MFSFKKSECWSALSTFIDDAYNTYPNVIYSFIIDQKEDWAIYTSWKINVIKKLKMEMTLLLSIPKNRQHKLHKKVVYYLKNSGI